MCVWCTHVCLHVGMCIWVQVSAEESDPLELYLQAFVIQLTWVLGTKFGSFEKAVHILNHWAISSAPPLFSMPMYFVHK